jgi:hypothetical protein
MLMRPFYVADLLAGGGVVGVAEEAEEAMRAGVAVYDGVLRRERDALGDCAEVECHAGDVTTEHSWRVHAAAVLQGFESGMAGGGMGHRPLPPGSLWRLARAGRTMTALRAMTAIRISYIMFTPSAEIAAY